jgi:RHS repeat-associated protein
VNTTSSISGSGSFWCSATTHETALVTTRQLHYIAGGDGLAAIYVKYDTGADSLFYIMQDHLGSLVGAINAESDHVYRQSFDAWGRERNYEDWTYTNVQDDFPFLRGYTGHEHLKWFGIINMNGRLYDPALCRFLSPDPFVQMPDNSQNFNRYSYCLNNPLIYSDPDGEWIHIVVGAAIGGVVNLTVKAIQGDIESWGDGIAAFGIGAVAGAVGAATGGAAFIAAGGGAAGAGGFLAGAVGGIAGSAYSMPIQSIGNSIFFGDPLMTGKEYLFGVGIGGLLGGTFNGGIALAKGKSFLTGVNKSLKFPVSAPTPKIQQVKLPKSEINTSGMKSQLKPMSNGVNPQGNTASNSGIHFFDKAKEAVQYSDGIPVKIVRDPNFRSNLISSTGINPGRNIHAHHVFPMEYAPQFQQAGINPNSYGAWWGTGHLSNASSYNQAWGNFFRNSPNATKSDILIEALRLKNLFGY